MKRTASVAAALLGVALVQPAVALAQEAPSAGDGSAEAVAAEVDGVVAAGETSARSGANDAEAEANALSIGGEPPSEQFGGKVGPTSEDSDADGSLIDTGDTPLGRLRVTPWEARTRKSDGGCRTATGRAAVARLTLLSPEVAHVNVLQSESNAAHCGSSSRGKAFSDGATVDLGDGALLLTLL
ncbi:MAG TPA: hypothetical protein VFK43_12380, partial [Acidimicrobiales bacterium]|nr:hypothetical protein [Acidimicrobiales bacterium]